MTSLPNKIIGAKAGGPGKFSVRMRWAACFAQFHRYTR